jgi:phenylacetate-CoA ligase
MPTLKVRVGHDLKLGNRPLQAVLDDLTDAIEQSVGVVPEIELVDNEDLLRLGPPHKIPRVASS